MPLSAIQLNEIKRKLRERGMSSDKIDISVKKMQEKYEEQYGGGSAPIPGGYSAPKTTQRTQNTSVSSSMTPRTTQSPPPRQQNMSSQPEQTDQNPISGFFRSLYSTGQDPQMVEQQKNLTGWRKTAQTVADAAPAVLGTVAGLGGAIVGGTAGSVVPGLGTAVVGAGGGAVGTGIGIAAGKAFENAIEDLIGTQDQTPLDQVKEQVVDAGTAAAIDFATGKVIGMAAPYIKEGFKKAGKFVSGVGDNLALRAVRPSPSQQRKFFQKTGMELKDFTVKNGLFSEGVEQVDELIAPMQQSFDDIAKSNDIKVPVSTIKQKFDDAIKFLTDQPTEQAASLAKKLTANRDLFLKKIGGKKEVTGAFVTEIRKNIDKVIPDSQFMKDPVAAAVDTQTRRVYQSALQESVGDLTVNGRNFKEIGRELQKLYSFREIAASQQYLGKGTLPVGIVKSLLFTGGFGIGSTLGPDQSLMGNIKEGLIVGTGSTLINNPKVVSFLTKQLMKNGEFLATLPDKELARAGTEIIRRSLTNIAALQLTTMGDDLEGIKSLDDQKDQQVNDSNTITEQPTDGITQSQGNQTGFDAQITPPNLDTSLPPEPEAPQIDPPFQGMSKYEVVQLAIARGFSGSQLEEVRSTYDIIMQDYEEAVGETGNLDEILKRRSVLKDQGVSTAKEDQQLQALGYNLVDETVEDKNLTEAEQARKDTGELVSLAISQFENTDPATGPVAPRFEQLKSLVNAGDQDTLDFYNTINLIKSGIAKARAGTSFTPNEEKLLNKYTPQEGDSYQKIQTKLKGLNQLFNSKGLDPQMDQKKKIDNTQDLQSDAGQPQQSASMMPENSLLADVADWTSEVGKKVKSYMNWSVDQYQKSLTADPSTLADAELLLRKPSELSKEDQIRQFDAGMQFMGTTKSTKSIAKAFKYIPLVEGKTLYALARNIKKLSAEDIENLRQGYKIATEVASKAPTPEQAQKLNSAINLLEELGVEGTRPTLKTAGKRIEKLVNYLADIDYKEIDYLENIGFEIPKLF